MYNTTNLTSATNFYLMTKGISDLTNGFFAPMLLFSLYIILFMLMKAYDTKASLVVVSFIVAAIAIMFYFLQLATPTVMIISIILPFIFIFIYVFTNN